MQLEYIHKLFIDKGSIGLKNLMEAKNYTDKEYINSILNYPKFYNSVRKNTIHSKDHFQNIKNSILKLKVIYPDLKSVPIYFSIGCLRTGGTILNNTILIGSEMS